MIYKNKKRGFTVAEIMVAVFIVAILAVLLIPMAASQLKRGDEYRYYMTYKTLEKVAKQLVAEPIYENTTALNNEQLPKIASSPSRVTFEEDTDTFKIKFDNAKDIIANILTPPVYGATCNSSAGLDDATIRDTSKEVGGFIHCPIITKQQSVELYTYAEFMDLISYECSCNPRISSLYGISERNAANLPKYRGSSMLNTAQCRNANHSIPAEANIPNSEEFENYMGFRTRLISMIGQLQPYMDLSDESFENRIQNFYKSKKYVYGNRLWCANRDMRIENTDEIDTCKIYNDDGSFKKCCNNTSGYYVESPPNCRKYYYDEDGNKQYIHTSKTWYLRDIHLCTLFFDKGSCFGNPEEKAHYYSNCSDDWRHCPTDPNPNYPIVRHLYQAQGGDFKPFYSYWDPGAVRDKSNIRATLKIINPPAAEIPPLSDYAAAIADNTDMCELLPRINMKQTQITLDDSNATKCVCKNNNYVLSYNNPFVCVRKHPSPPADTVPYYYNNAESPVYCAIDSFNSSTGQCCRAEGEASGTGDGWLYDAKNNVCIQTNKYNPVGFLNDGKDFCEKIAENWNIKNSNCNVFPGYPGYNDKPFNSLGRYYWNLYPAINGNGLNKQNSIENLKNGRGAFKTLEPNIEFSNGIKLWILGDREASMSGLSYPLHESSHKWARAMCYSYVPTTTGRVHDAATAKSLQEHCHGDAKYGYSYCPGENKCYRFIDSLPDTTILPDARSCCMNYSINNSHTLSRYNPVSGFTVYADINGDGGAGTLWDDVFPFYITTSGNVIPGYPIDASKDPADNPSVYMAGNSATYLPVDVYYYATRDQSKKRVLVSSNISFARGACIAGLVPEQTYYCQNIFDRNPETGANKNTAYEKD